MRAYSGGSFRVPGRKGRPWRWYGAVFLFGFIGGLVVANILAVRKPVELIISTPAPTPTVADESVPEAWSDSGNISVRIPQTNAVVASPLVVEGMERTFEQNVVVRLKDAGGRELVKTFTTGTAPDLGIHGPYRAELIFEKPKTRSGTLEVFQNSPKDGSEIDMVRVPIRFE